jgi:Fe-S cluster biogenesis protein NfuA
MDHAIEFHTDVTAAVEEVARILRADGADLELREANAKTARIHLTLVLDTVSCEECVLPPAMLYETIEQSLHRKVPGEFELVLDDPRSAAPPS